MIFTTDRGNYFQAFCKNLNLLLGVSLLQNLTLSRQLKMAFWKSKMLIGNFSLEFSNKIFTKVFENLFSQEYGLNSIWNPKSKAHISWSPNTVSNAQDSQRKPFATLFKEIFHHQPQKMGSNHVVHYQTCKAFIYVITSVLNAMVHHFPENHHHHHHKH